MMNKYIQTDEKKKALSTVIVVALIAMTSAGTVHAQGGPVEVPDEVIDLVCGTEPVGEVACTTGGDKAWVVTHDGSGSGPDEVRAIEVSPDGSRIYVTAWTSAEGTGRDIAVIAYDTEGSQIWMAQFDGPINGRDFPHNLAISPGGSTIFVTGESEGLGTNVDYVTLALDAETGNQDWAARYEGETADSWDYPQSIAISPDGETVFVTGTSGPGILTWDIATVAYDAVDGSEVWTQRYASPTTDFFRLAIGNAVAVGPSSDTIYITGTSVSPSGGFNSDFTTIAYDAATGSEIWLARYDGPSQGDDQAQDLALSSDGSLLYVTGASEDTNKDYATVAYDTTDGTQLWVTRYEGPAGHDNALAIGLSPDDSRLFVTGDSRTTQGAEMATVSYDAADGAEMWVQRYQGPGTGFDTARNLAVAPQGDYVAITGTTYGEEGGDLTTIVYSTANGTQLWADRNNGPADRTDEGLALAISPEGERVYSGGSVRTPSTSRDAVTIAYNGRTGLPELGLGPQPVPDLPVGG